MACLVIVSGDQAGTYYQLARRPLTGGRDPASEIQLIDPKVSRRHFQIRLGPDGYVIREMRSLNGIHVNRVRINGERRLRDGDRIRIGITFLEFYEEENPDRTNALDLYRKGDRHLRENETISA
jgi:pSer/pThr/pTyr-binding forkhead associated (FHA) protein